MILKFTEYTVHDNLRYLVTLLFERWKRFYRFRFHSFRKKSRKLDCCTKRTILQKDLQF